MKTCHIWSLSILVILSLFFSISLPAQTGAVLLTNNKLKSKLDSAVDFAAKIYLQDSNTRGVSIGVRYEKGNYTYNYGKTQLAGADSYYNLGSVAKTFITTILAKAVVDKKLKLDDDIRKFLPGSYPNLEYSGQPIRFVHLANHTSALPKTFRVFSSAIQDSLSKLSLSQQVDFYSIYSRDSLLSDLHFARPDTIPGTRYQYNSSAMRLLELLLERVYQKSYEKIVTDYLRSQLKMFHTKPILTNAEMKEVVQGYDDQGEAQQFQNLKGFYLGPSMNSTINDMLKYVEANLTNRDSAIWLSHQLSFGKEVGFGMGLGWMMENDENGERYIYHTGNTRIGYNTVCIFYPGKDLGFIIIANDTTSQENVGQIENNIRKLLGKK